MRQEAVGDALGVLPGGGEQGEREQAPLVVVHGQAHVKAQGLFRHLCPDLGLALQRLIQRGQPPVAPLADDGG